MATIRKTQSGKWQAVIRKKGWPNISKTFQTKSNAEAYSRYIEDQMARGVYRTPTKQAS